MSARETIECAYQGGVFKPIENSDLVEGIKLKIKIEKVDLSKYYDRWDFLLQSRRCSP
ncbi:MAG: antitoxin family protein [Methanothrix sp.]|nr:antitoxin family protein [Methanothrix sp.]